jgi:proliferating cell nuclear antigen PCNA
MILFKAKSCEGYTFKVLSELLQNSLKECCFICKPSGIYLVGVDTKYKNGSKLICLNLIKEKFTIYKLIPTELKIGINLIHFYKMLKSIKRKDTLTLSIEDDDPNKLIITIEQLGEKNATVKHINLTKIQPVDVNPLDEKMYPDPIIVTSKQFQKLKDLNKMSKYMNITVDNRIITFYCDKDNIYSSKVVFGEQDEDNEDSEIYTQSFLTEEIIQLIKVAGLSQTIQIYFVNGLPLKFNLNVGSLGNLTIFIKSQEELSTMDTQDNNEEE